VGNAQIVMVMHGRTELKPDDKVKLSVDARKTHVFDGTTGRRIGNGTATAPMQ
jgi:multiple sugar transport system ATP-binding protein